MNITRVKIKNEKYLLQYTEKNGNTEGLDKLSLSTDEPGTPSFLDAFGKMKTHLVDLCEFSKKDIERLKVIMVDIKEEEEAVSVMLYGIVSVSKAKAGYSVKSPQYTYRIGQEKTDLGDNKNVMQKDCYDDLLILIEEAKKYINGERSQVEFDFEATGDEQDDEVMTKAVG